MGVTDTTANQLGTDSVTDTATKPIAHMARDYSESRDHQIC